MRIDAEWKYIVFNGPGQTLIIPKNPIATRQGIVKGSDRVEVEYGQVYRTDGRGNVEVLDEVPLGVRIFKFKHGYEKD